MGDGHPKIMNGIPYENGLMISPPICANLITLDAQMKMPRLHEFRRPADSTPEDSPTGCNWLAAFSNYS